MNEKEKNERYETLNIKRLLIHIEPVYEDD